MSCKWIFALLFLLVAVLPAGAPAGEALRVLIFSGQNNHPWQETTPKIKAILEAEGRFAADVTEHPERCDAALLAQYRLVVSDWNAWGNVPVASWPEAARAAYLEFVRGGRGFVAVHAGSSSFADWPEYRQIAGAWWELGQTGHGAPHQFTVQAVADHAITQGLVPFTTTDELWLRPGVHPAAQVLAQGDDQPVAVVTQFGQGRGFTLLLGHTAGFMDTPGFQTLLRRGAEWAATGQVAVRDVWKPLGGYQYGQSRAILREVAQLAQAAPRELAPKLAALLDSDATLDARQFACQQLGLVGSAAEVPALARQLASPELATAALAALECIPGEEPLAALRAALPGATGPLRQGLIGALGARRDAQAVPLLIPLLPDTADALAAIGTPAALAALQGAQPQPTAALLRCALALGDVAVLRQLAAADQPPAIRTAAFTGQVQALGDQGEAVVLTALGGDDPVLRAAAVSLLRGRVAVKAAARWAEWPADVHVPLLAALAASGEAAALPTVTAAVASEDPAIRRAAIAALGALGDAATVPVLLGLMEGAARDDQQGIAEALVRLRGPGVDEALLTSGRPEALRALVARGATAAVPALLAQAEQGDTEAIAALGRLAGAKDGPRLIALLGQAGSRPAVEAALVALYRREGDVPGLAAVAAQAGGPRKASLLAVLGALGGDVALAALREGLKDPAIEVQLAAVRALSNWPTGAPLADLQTVVQTATDARLKALAARGAARLDALGLDVSGMPNLALGGTATNPDGLRSDGQGGPPAAAIDGDRNTYWDEVDGEKLYQLRVQMKRPAQVRAIRIIGFHQHSYAPKDFDIVCDDRLVASVADATYSDNALTVALPPTRCTTIQLNITGVHGPSPAIRELEIYGQAD